jgi:hypothetical protein
VKALNRDLSTLSPPLIPARRAPRFLGSGSSGTSLFGAWPSWRQLISPASA